MQRIAFGGFDNFPVEKQILPKRFLLLKKIQQENIQAVMLVTDGNVTAGFTPLWSGRIEIPVYTIGVGDTTEQQDILVAKFSQIQLHTRSKLPMEVVVHNNGYDNISIMASLFENGKMLEQKND